MVNVGDTVRMYIEGEVKYIGFDGRVLSLSSDDLTYRFEHARFPFECEVLEAAHILPTEPGSQIELTLTRIDSSIERKVYTLSKDGLWYDGPWAFAPRTLDSFKWKLKD